MNLHVNTSFFEWLALALIVLKLCHVITWSWWCVLTPLLIPVVMVVFIICIALWGIYND